MRSTTWTWGLCALLWTLSAGAQPAPKAPPPGPEEATTNPASTSDEAKPAPGEESVDAEHPAGGGGAPTPPPSPPSPAVATAWPGVSLAEATPDSWPPNAPDSALAKNQWLGATDFPITPARGPVVDFCGMTPKGDAAVQYQKKRVLWFAAAGLDGVESDPWIAFLDGHDMAREAWQSRVPLERFHNVLTSIDGVPDWVDRDDLSYDEIDQRVLDAATDRPFAGPEGNLRDEKLFILYSLRCVDYIMVSTVRAAPVSWDWRQIKQVKGENGSASAEAYQLYVPNIRMTGATTAFRRNGDRFEKVATFPTNIKGNIDQDKNKPAWDAMPDHVSAIPTSACQPNFTHTGTPGLGAGCETGVADATMVAHAHYEVNGRVCEEREKKNVEAWIRCEPRTATEQFIGDVHIQIRRHPEFMLYGRLQSVAGDRDRPGIGLGDDEGVKVGYGFAHVDDEGWMQTYYKVTSVGTGGPEGVANPSEMNLRFGDVPPDGTRLEEYALTGFSMWLKGHGGGLFLNEGAVPITSGPLAGNQFAMPRFVTGGGIGFALDWGGLVDVPELYTKLDFSVLYGTNGSTDLIMFPVDWPWIEKGFYIGRRLKLNIGGGMVWNGIQVTLRPDVGEDQTVSAFSLGGAGEVGLEVMLRPDFFFRVDAQYRMVAPPNYDDDDAAIVGEFAARNDLLASASGRMGIGYEF